MILSFDGRECVDGWTLKVGHVFDSHGQTVPIGPNPFMIELVK